MKWLWYAFLTLFSLGMIGFVAGIGVVAYAISYYGRDLPDYEALQDYKPPVVTRVYAGDGRLMAEFAQEKRVFVPIESIPPLVRQAFIAAEDQNFYRHHGVDVFAIARAAVSNFKNMGHSKRPVGASTITQQVAKNFLLTNEVSIARKIREAILAFRMERVMSKDRLLELYLNEIYLGQGTYGVAAASLHYFNKPLEDLKPEEAAFLAALPKAPNNYHPVRKHDAAIARRNWVLERMREDNYLTNDEARAAAETPLLAQASESKTGVSAPYFAEEVRRELRGKYGEESLYQGGLVVRTSLDPRLQALAAKALRNGLVEYDKRHGWRGPLGKISGMSSWQAQLKNFKHPPVMLDSWKLAVVLGVTDDAARIGFEDGTEDKLLREYVTWARGRDGAAVSSVKQVVAAGDIIMAERVIEDGKNIWGLRQIPKVNGALIALDPHTGRVLAMQGGWSYEESEFNRATQAMRQPGSAFKPFVYLTALEKGFTPSTLILDAPYVFDQGPGMPKWAPENYTREYYGPTPLRVGIEKSRNLMTVRLAQHIGMENVAETSKKFGVIDNLEPHLANSLGSGETTLLRLATGYAQFVNGGRRIQPTFIDRIQDRTGSNIFRHDNRGCPDCGPLVDWASQAVPDVLDQREQIADPRYAYQIVSILEGVVERGTAVKAKVLERPLAGKTGTTNESRDTWFIGFSPDLVCGVFVGFDEPATLGKKETGSSVALPAWIEFMRGALADQPPVPFRIPPGIRQVQVNSDTGARAHGTGGHIIWESFLAGTEPTNESNMLDDMGLTSYSTGTGDYGDTSGSLGTLGGEDNANPPADSATTGTGGLY